MADEQPMTIEDEDQRPPENEVKVTNQPPKKSEASADAQTSASGSSEVSQASIKPTADGDNANVSQPGTSQQETSQQETSQPGTSQQETNQSDTSQQETSQPGTSQQETSQSGASQPGTSQSGSNQPSSSAQNISMEVTPDVSEDEPGKLPFQVQIDFTGRDSGKYCRVITNLRERTTQRKTAESGKQCRISDLHYEGFLLIIKYDCDV